MNKTITHNNSYMSLLENTVNELFSPSSKKAIINYEDLKLIDVDQLKVIDINQFKLLDLNELNLVNFAVLSVFFQYVGALFLTLAFGFMVSFGAFTIHSAINTTVMAEETPVIAVKQRAAKAEFVNVQGKAVVARPTSSFAALIDTKEAAVAGSEAAVSREVAVLGVSAEKEQVESPANACSFRVVEGEKSSRFSSGSRYTPAKVFKLCVDSNKGSAAFGWNLGTETSSNISDCITSYELSGVSAVSVTMMDEAGEASGTCELSLVKSAVIAANN